MKIDPGPDAPVRWRDAWPAGLAWPAGALALARLDDRVDLGTLAMALVLSAAIGSRWLPVGAGALSAALAVLGFNGFPVPPLVPS